MANSFPSTPVTPNPLEDREFRGRLIVALKTVIADHFTHEDWTEFGYATQTRDFIANHDRLLRSLHFGNDDYGTCVFQTLEYVFNHAPHAVPVLFVHAKLKADIQDKYPELLARFGVATHRVAAPPVDAQASEVVVRALRDVDTLLAAGGPVHVVDRLHTALHGYLRETCAAHAIPLAPDASLTAAFKAFRTSHPAVTDSPRSAQTGAVLQSLASAVDTVNAFRNNASIAHPNEQLLSADEADLVVNLVHSLFRYLQAISAPAVRPGRP